MRLDKSQLSINHIIAKTLNISLDDVSESLSYQSISEWDSIAHINLMLAIEQHYDIVIDQERVLKLISVEEIKKYIYSNNTNISNFSHNKESLSNVVIKRGLSDVFYDNTHISSIDNNYGDFLYFGYNIDDLVEFSSFEEVIYLLLNKKMPNSYELMQFNEIFKSYCFIPQHAINIITLMQNAHPIDVLRTVISSLPIFNFENNQNTINNTLNVGVQIIAQIPLIIAAHNAIKKGKNPIAPLTGLSYAANFLYMINDETPSEEVEKIFNATLILQAEHGSNASTFTGRVAAATIADMHAAVTAALATFSGPLHGGAVEKVMEMLHEIGGLESVRNYIQNRMANNDPIFGFGHRLYRNGDPRTAYLKEHARNLSIIKGKTKFFAILELIQEEMKPYVKYGLHPNVDFYGAMVYSLMDIPTDLFISTFAASRSVGWIAHILEQYSNNVLIRPRLNYIGQHKKTYIPIDMRNS